MRGLYEIFYAPEDVYKKQQTPWVPFIASLVLILIATLLFTKISFPFIMERIKERISQLPPEQQEKALSSFTLSKALIFGTIGSIINTTFKLVLFSLIYYLIFIAFGVTLRYISVMIPVAYGLYIAGIGNIFKVFISFITKNPYPQTSLALFYGKFTPELAKLWHYKIASHVDIFTLWSLFIIATGFYVITGLERKKTFMVVFGLWGVYILITAFIPFPVK